MFQAEPSEGLRNLPPILKTHPQTTPREVVEQILALGLAHPAWGWTAAILAAIVSIDVGALSWVASWAPGWVWVMAIYGVSIGWMGNTACWGGIPVIVPW